MTAIVNTTALKAATYHLSSRPKRSIPCGISCFCHIFYPTLQMPA